MEITLTPQESEQMFYDSMCNVFGNGWFDGYGLELEFNEEDYDQSKEKLNNPCFEDVLLQILKDGKKLTLVDVEYDGEYTRSITIDDISTRDNYSLVIQFHYTLFIIPSDVFLGFPKVLIETLKYVFHVVRG